MKIAAYEVKASEKPIIESLCEEKGIELVYLTSETLSKDNISHAEGVDGVTSMGQSLYPKDILDTLKGYGVKVVATRTVGYDNIDKEYAKEIGMTVTHGSYAPNGVAEMTLLGILATTRQLHKSMILSESNDFRVGDLVGTELRSQTVGVLGTGKIGATVIGMLSGFGCRILAYDVYQNENVKKYAEYVDFDTILRECDIITLHLPMLPETTKIINKDTIAKMKDGVIIINCARGPLMDSNDVLQALQDEKIGGMFIDAFPGEEGIIHLQHNLKVIESNREAYFKLKYLRSFPNVIHTPHIAWNTKEAGESMARCGVLPIYDVLTTGDSPQIIPELR